VPRPSHGVVHSCSKMPRPSASPEVRPSRPPTVAGLFAGIGGIELGLGSAGHDCQLLCEIDPGARRVLSTHFPEIDIREDIRRLASLPKVDVVAAGFPCQDLSQAGGTAGIRGNKSGVVAEVFRLLANRKSGPRWLLVENVSFMLQLDSGTAMRFLVDSLESLGFAWAYRVVDTRAFGLPQRRQRVIMVASRTEDPRGIVLADDAGEWEQPRFAETWCGFYWTEGLRGLGWAVDAIPTLKGGSTIGIPSPPAIWNPLSGEFFTPDIRDAERIQGFTADWTAPAVLVPGVRTGHRWKLAGNAVSVPVARWIGHRLANPATFSAADRHPVARGMAWPKAAWGHSGRVFRADVSMWPSRVERPRLADFIRFPVKPLSARAASGFLKRARTSSLRFEDGFLEALERHIRRVSTIAAA
jgi:DNA (cytosine-5)-methyltransferase 1